MPFRHPLLPRSPIQASPSPGGAVLPRPSSLVQVKAELPDDDIDDDDDDVDDDVCARVYVMDYFHLGALFLHAFKAFT
jgi:hypothetical protein